MGVFGDLSFAAHNGDLLQTLFFYDRDHENSRDVNIIKFKKVKSGHFQIWSIDLFLTFT